MSPDARHRRTSRIILLDETDRALLFYTKGSVPAQRTRWITPGGGVDEGESHHEAAVRELFEETGLVVDDLGDPVWSLDFAVDYAGGDHDTGHAEYYLLRASAFIPSSENWTDDERIDVLEHRWFTIDQLRSESEPVDPPVLAEVIERFLR